MLSNHSQLLLCMSQEPSKENVINFVNLLLPRSGLQPGRLRLVSCVLGGSPLPWENPISKAHQTDQGMARVSSPQDGASSPTPEIVV